MGRPKVSQRIKCIAHEFVKIVTKGGAGGTSEDCISINAQFGRKSLHSAMQFCLPHLTRSGTVSDNREGISQMEINKLVRSQGHSMARKRDSIHPGRREWTDIRWLTPCPTSKNADYMHIQSSLQDLHRNFPETLSCTVESVVEFIAIARRPISESDYAKAMEERISRMNSNSPNDDDDDDDDDDEPEPTHRSNPTAFSRCSSSRTVPRDPSISRAPSAHIDSAAHQAHDESSGYAAAGKRAAPRAWADDDAAQPSCFQPHKKSRKLQGPPARDGAFALADVAAPLPGPSTSSLDAIFDAAAAMPPFSGTTPSQWSQAAPSCFLPGGANADSMSPLIPGLVGELLRSQLLLSQYSSLLRTLIAPATAAPAAPAGPPSSPPTLQPLHLMMQSLLPPPPTSIEAPDPAAIAAAMQLHSLQRAHRNAVSLSE